MYTVRQEQAPLARATFSLIATTYAAFLDLSFRARSISASLLLAKRANASMRRELSQRGQLPDALRLNWNLLVACIWLKMNILGSAATYYAYGGNLDVSPALKTEAIKARQMNKSSDNTDHEKIWGLIKGAHSALLITVSQDGSLDSRPMGCLQKSFGGILWFLTFRHSLKLSEIRTNPHVLVSYAKPSEFEYVSISGKARVIEDSEKLKELWTEGLRVWFPKGPDDPEIAILAVDVEQATYWTDAASMATYAWAYVKARLTGKSPSADEIATVKSIRF